MTKDHEGVARAQFELFGRVARAFKNRRKSGAANITTGLVEARLQALESNWAKFEAQHDKLVIGAWDALAGHDYRVNYRDFASQAEEAYLTQKGMFLDALHELNSEASVEIPVVAPESSSANRTTLPCIQLPQFFGRYEDWPSFRDLFHSIIREDANITRVEKLHYLKSCLKGKADLLVRSLPTTDENFERAWRSLTNHFENKRLLVRSYLSKFTALQKLKGESSSDLRNLCHTVNSLESIGRPITNGEDLFVYLIVELLDLRSRCEWENAVSETTELPSYEELQRLLDRRVNTLESLQPVKAEAISSKTSSGPARQTRFLHARNQETKRGRCSLCGKDHYIICDVYQVKTAEARKQHVETHNLCLNCLGKHKLAECSSKKTCSSCHARHHTTLHDACSNSEVATTSHVARHQPETPTAVLLATARVRVTDRFGNFYTARALVDQGSESSLISEALAQRLRLPRALTSVALFGIGGKQADFARGQVALQIGDASFETLQHVQRGGARSAHKEGAVYVCARRSASFG
ncbi:hypothetical protein RF55_18361, partial [Lasius niger]